MLLSRTLSTAVLAASCLFAGAALAQTPAAPQIATAPRVLGSPDAPVEVMSTPRSPATTAPASTTTSCHR
jgi:hypothetical protein